MLACLNQSSDCLHLMLRFEGGVVWPPVCSQVKSSQVKSSLLFMYRLDLTVCKLVRFARVFCPWLRFGKLVTGVFDPEGPTLKPILKPVDYHLTVSCRAQPSQFISTMLSALLLASQVTGYGKLPAIYSPASSHTRSPPLVRPSQALAALQ